MKKNLFVIVVVILAVCATFYANTTTKVELNDLAFKNVEALAKGEEVNFRCYGDGEVDCFGEKVEYMVSGFSLK